MHLKARTRSPSAVADDESPPAEWHAWWHNYQHGSARPPTFKISNMIFGTFYISAVADADAVIRQIGESPLHVIVLQVEKDDSAVAEAFLQCTRGALSPQLREAMANKTLMFLNRRLFIAMHKHVVADLLVTRVTTQPEASFAVVRFKIKPCMTAVAVGIVDSPPYGTRLPQWLMQAMHDTVVQQGARILTGVFGHTAKQMTELCQNLPLATAEPLFQGWKKPAVAGSSSASSSAVAETTMCFPAYTLLFGVAP